MSGSSFANDFADWPFDPLGQWTICLGIGRLKKCSLISGFCVISAPARVTFLPGAASLRGHRVGRRPGGGHRGTWPTATRAEGAPEQEKAVGV